MKRWHNSMLMSCLYHFWSETDLKDVIDIDLWLHALEYSIKARRENLCWLMHNVTVDRSDEWRDRKFREIQADIDALVAEREMALEQSGATDA